MSGTGADALIRLKAWAARVKDDRKWKAGACQLSREHLAHVLATGLVDLAKEGYRYLETVRQLAQEELARNEGGARTGRCQSARVRALARQG